MDLIDEYVQRHGFKEPYVKFAKRSELWLKGNSDQKIYRMVVHCKQENNKPPYFILSILTDAVVTVDGHLDNMDIIFKKNVCEKDSDFRSLLNDIKYVKNDYLYDKEPIQENRFIDNLWNILIFSIDKHLLSITDIDFYENLYDSLAEKNAVKKEKLINNCMCLVADKHQKIYRAINNFNLKFKPSEAKNLWLKRHFID